MAVARAKVEGTDKLLDFVVGKVQHDSGTGKEVGSLFEDERDRVADKHINKIDSSMRRNLKATGKRALSKEENEIVRETLFGNAPQRTTSELTSLAADIRGVMTDAYLAAKKAGISLGFVENQGYLPRILDNIKIEGDTKCFLERAKKVYIIHLQKNLVPGMAPDELTSFADNVSKQTSPGTDGPLVPQAQAKLDSAVAN